MVLWAGWPFFERGWASLKTMNLNMFTLIAMGTGVAWTYSIIGTIAPGLFPASMRGHDGSIAIYFRQRPSSPCSCCLARCSSQGARADERRHQSLLDLSPKMARRIKPDDGDEDVSLDQVVVGDPARAGQASVSPSTARSATAAAPSTSRW